MIHKNFLKVFSILLVCNASIFSTQQEFIKPEKPHQLYVPKFDQTGPISKQRPDGSMQKFQNHTAAVQSAKKDFAKQRQEYRHALAEYRRSCKQ